MFLTPKEGGFQVIDISCIRWSSSSQGRGDASKNISYYFVWTLFLEYRFPNTFRYQVNFQQSRSSKGFCSRKHSFQGSQCTFQLFCRSNLHLHKRLSKFYILHPSKRSRSCKLSRYHHLHKLGNFPHNPNIFYLHLDMYRLGSI